jgi:hypothetical protein
MITSHDIGYRKRLQMLTSFSEFDTKYEQGIILYTETSRPTLGTTQLRIQFVKGYFPRGIAAGA